MIRLCRSSQPALLPLPNNALEETMDVCVVAGGMPVGMEQAVSASRYVQVTLDGHCKLY